MLRLIASVSLVTVLTHFLGVQGVSQSSPLTEEAIAHAIEIGIAGRAAPHRLPSLRGVVVYTTTIRIALAAQRLHQRGHRDIRPQDLPSWVTAPYTWVVFNQPCIEPDDCHGAPYHRGLPVTEVAVDWNPTAPRSPMRAKAVEVTTDLSFFSALGGLPFEHAVLAAAFEPRAFRSGLSVFAIWTLPDNKSHVFAIGQITDEDVARISFAILR